MYKICSLLCFIYMFAVINCAGLQTQTEDDISGVTQTIKEFEEYGKFLTSSTEDDASQVREGISPWKTDAKVDEFIQFSRNFVEQFLSSSQLSRFLSYISKSIALKFLLVKAKAGLINSLPHEKDSTKNKYRKQKHNDYCCQKITNMVNYAIYFVASMTDKDAIMIKSGRIIATQTTTAILKSLPHIDDDISDEMESIIPPDVRVVAYLAGIVTRAAYTKDADGPGDLVLQKWLDDNVKEICKLCEYFDKLPIAKVEGTYFDKNAEINLDETTLLIALAEIILENAKKYNKSLFDKAKSGDAKAKKGWKIFVDALRKVSSKLSENFEEAKPRITQFELNYLKLSVETDQDENFILNIEAELFFLLKSKIDMSNTPVIISNVQNLKF